MIYFKIRDYKKIIGLIILVISLQFGVYAIALGQVISGIISTFINAYPNKELLYYSYKEQWIDIKPSLLLSIVMGSIVYSFNFLYFAAWKILFLQVAVGAIIYIGLSKILRVENFNYLINTIKEFVNLRKN